MAGFDRLRGAVSKVAFFFECLGALALLLMFFADLVDVVGSKLFSRPLRGAVEVIGYLQVVAISGAVAMGLFLNRHIRVEFLVDRLGPRARGIISCLSSLLGFLLFGILSWQSFSFGLSLKESGEIGSTSYIPLYPFAFFISFASIPVCLVFLVEIVESVRKGE